MRDNSLILRRSTMTAARLMYALQFRNERADSRLHSKHSVRHN